MKTLSFGCLRVRGILHSFYVRSILLLGAVEEREMVPSSRQEEGPLKDQRCGYDNII
jgi:hypothetical protein